MQAHLEQGCAECLKSWTFWRLILDVSSRETSYSPGPDAIRAAKDAYIHGESWKWLREVAQFAELVFDSFRQASPAMVRGAGPTCRQLVHDAEPFVIDLRLESDPIGRRTFLTGQVLNSANPEEMLGDIDVVLLSGERLIKRTVATNSGEFELELGHEQDMQLFINIRGERAIGITLPSLGS
jgi:hypothetical protein